VVYGDSAIIEDAEENRVTIHADHMGMSKFSSRVDPEYKKVLYAIENLLERLSLSESDSENAG
jgi:protein SERAC1